MSEKDFDSVQLLVETAKVEALIKHKKRAISIEQQKTVNRDFAVMELRNELEDLKKQRRDLLFSYRFKVQGTLF